MTFAELFDPMRCIVADAIQRAKHDIGLWQDRAQSRPATMQAPIVMNELTILSLHQRAEVSTLPTSSAHIKNAATKQIDTAKAIFLSCAAAAIGCQ